MKCTLRKVDKGIIATIDERPEMDECYYNTVINEIQKRSLSSDRLYSDSDHKIIASNLGVGMELWLVQQGQVPFIPNEVNSHFFMDKEYSYSIVDGKVVVEL